MRATVLSCVVHTCRVRSIWILTWPSGHLSGKEEAHHYMSSSLASCRRPWRRYDGQLSEEGCKGSGGVVQEGLHCDSRLFSFSVSDRARIAPRNSDAMLWRAGACLRRGRIVAWRGASHMPLTGRNTFQHKHE
ncbi:hypothetical protein V8C44DRAFT_352648 [Trichoderma aethiopicum]